MAPADEIKEQGVRFVRAGWRAVKVTAEKLPGADRIRGRGGTGTKTAPPEYVLVEDPPDDFKKCYLSILVWLVHFYDNRIDERELDLGGDQVAFLSASVGHPRDSKGRTQRGPGSNKIGDHNPELTSPPPPPDVA